MISEYRMTSVNVGDILIRNDDPKINNIGFSVNSNRALLTDEFECVCPPRSMKKYALWSGDNDIIFVKNLRNDEEFSCFWWRFKKPVEKYDPTQMGDKEDDI